VRIELADMASKELVEVLESTRCWCPAGCPIRQRSQPGQRGGANPARCHPGRRRYARAGQAAKPVGPHLWALGSMVNRKMMPPTPPLPQGSCGGETILGHSRRDRLLSSIPPPTSHHNGDQLGGLSESDARAAGQPAEGFRASPVRSYFKAKHQGPWPNSTVMG